jgi:hypothetical protein
MQVLCKASATDSDLKCKICGQGFLVYWTRSSAEERARRSEEILDTLSEQHINTGSNSIHAHPETAFNLPEWSGEPRFSAAALIGNAPSWATA